MFFLDKKHLTQRNLYTLTANISFYRATFLHAETLPRAVFTQHILFRTETFKHKTNYAQQFLQTDGFYTESSPHRSLTHRRRYAQHFFTYRRFYTQMSLHRHKLHRNLCTQHAFTHNQILHREALFPLLDHLPFVFPPPLKFLYYTVFVFVSINWRIQPHELHVYQQVWGHNMEFVQREIQRTPRSPLIWR